MENELGRIGFDPVRVEISPEDLADHPGLAPVPWDYEGRHLKRYSYGEGLCPFSGTLVRDD